MSREEKQAAYNCRHHLRHEQRVRLRLPARQHGLRDTSDRVQRGLNYAIVDEVDSILIDEARTPLIISGQAEDHTEMYVRINAVVPQLKAQIGEEDPAHRRGRHRAGRLHGRREGHQVTLTEEGHENAEERILAQGLLVEGASLYDPANIALMHHVYAALRANHLYTAISTTSCQRRGRDRRRVHRPPDDGPALVRRPAPGRRGQGRREIQSENQTLASITFQNYFRMYTKLSGMTGTADTEAYEFQEIYGLETVVIPPNKPHAARTSSTWSTRPAREVRGGDPRHSRLPRARPAGAGRHHLDRELGAALGLLAKQSCRTRCSTPSSTRAKPRSWRRPAARA
jgi:preprotein translocase subunit SecA